jgi:hypothetical protein
MMMNRYYTYNWVEIPGIQSRIRIESFSFEQQTMNNEKAKNQRKTKVEQKMNKNLMKIKQINKST